MLGGAFRIDACAQAVAKRGEAGEAGGDGRRVVNGNGLLGTHAEHKEAHGNAVVKIGLDYRAAFGCAAGNGKAVAFYTILHAAAGKPFGDGT